MKKRVITGACFTALLLFCIFAGKPAMLALLSAAMIRSFFEMYRAIRAKGIEPVRWAGYVFCGIVIASETVELILGRDLNLTIFALAVGMMATMIRLVLHGEIAVESMMATVFPILYPGVFYLLMMEMLKLGSAAAFVVAFVLIFFSASICDAFALFSGMLFGKHKLAPILSPKKTVEGAIGGWIACILFSMAVPAIVRLFLPHDTALLLQNDGILYRIADLNAMPPRWAFAILGAVIGVLTQIGDLVASMIKRHFGVKDFGHLLPGHGGVMDRLDGILFCVPAVWLFFKILQH